MSQCLSYYFIYFLQLLFEVSSSNVIPILQMRKIRHREV